MRADVSFFFPTFEPFVSFFGSGLLERNKLARKLLVPLHIQSQCAHVKADIKISNEGRQHDVQLANLRQEQRPASSGVVSIRIVTLVGLQQS